MIVKLVLVLALVVMDPRVEEMLLAKAIADGQNQITNQDAALIGAGLGVTSSFLPGIIPNTQMNIAPPNAMHRVDNARKRMAGGFVGAVLGGALGPAVRQVAIQDSPAAALLAKAQAQGGELSVEDTQNLQNILAETYSEMGLR